MMARVDFAAKAAAKHAAAVVAHWDWATLQSPHAIDRLVKSWGLDPGAARRVVQAERYKRPKKR